MVPPGYHLVVLPKGPRVDGLGLGPRVVGPKVDGLNPSVDRPVGPAVGPNVVRGGRLVLAGRVVRGGSVVATEIFKKIMTYAIL